jgi:hypothetical protein
MLRIATLVSRTPSYRTEHLLATAGSRRHDPVVAECDQRATERNATDRDSSLTDPHQDGENQGVNLRYP